MNEEIEHAKRENRLYRQDEDGKCASHPLGDQNPAIHVPHYTVQKHHHADRRLTIESGVSNRFDRTADHNEVNDAQPKEEDALPNQPEVCIVDPNSDRRYTQAEGEERGGLEVEEDTYEGYNQTTHMIKEEKESNIDLYSYLWLCQEDRSRRDCHQPMSSTYEKKTQREHILIRPDTYVGSNEVAEILTWLFDPQSSSMIFRDTKYVPALLKIFDEILVNAADNRQRDPKGTKNIKVTMDAERGEISIYNDGKGIPVVVHEEGMYVPELIFGHLLTGSNFDDTKERTTGGRNGMGANLTSIFSSCFRVNLSDGIHTYDQEWTDNMTVCGRPTVRKDTKKKSFTRVTFRPDLAHFKGIAGLGELDVMSILERRVRDVAGTMPKSLKVYLNGNLINVRGFKAYAKSFGGSVTVLDDPSGKWSIGLSTSPDGDGFQQVSFVNHIATLLGGNHVTHLTNRLITMITKAVGKKRGISARNLKRHHIRNNLRLFVSCLVVNPKFSSQSKESLTSRVDTFYPLDLPETFVETFLRNSDLVTRLEELNEKVDAKSLSKTDGAKTTRIKGIPKLEDANWAGTRKSDQCTLILTEGDSAKALAVAGLSVVGRNKYGVFPLRGKLINARGASKKVLENNAEVTALKTILGLKQECDYSTAAEVKRLRYRHVMVMADQDPDGSHIKGLIINLFEHFWPNLLKVPGFMQQFATPIVVCTHPTNKKKKESFFTLSDYRKFKNGLGGRWKAKYYKGLGTSTSEEGKSYFRDLPRHVTDFTYEAQCADAIEMAFGADSDRRKAFVSQVVYEPADYDPSVRSVSCRDFVQKELVVYSSLSVNRAIPSMVDGLKPGQRKILYVCLKRGLWKEIKVAQLAGSVSETSAYHHGEVSLCGTIVNMAQNFVGSNNENLLLPKGQFGTRNKGTKEAASARYIFTSLAPCVKKLFRTEDAGILEHLEDDGMTVEPRYYYPLLPLVLINGACGIGTGYSTFVPCHATRHVYEAVKAVLSGKTYSLHPSYRGFHGTILEKSPGCYENRGLWSWSADQMELTVTELPVGLWTHKYKLRLCKLEEDGLITFHNNSDDIKVMFTVSLTPGTKLDKTREKLVAPLSATMYTTNMHLYDETGTLRGYQTAYDIVVDFVRVRLEAYRLRAAYMVSSIKIAMDTMLLRARFLEDVLSGVMVVARRPVVDVLKEMEVRGYDESFLSMSLRSMTADKLEELRKEIESARVTIQHYQTVTPTQLYLSELAEMMSTKTERKDDEVDDHVTKKRRMK